MNGDDMARLVEVRDEIAGMLEDPMNGYGIEITDRGFDPTGAAEFAFDLKMRAERYEVQIRRIP